MPEPARRRMDCAETFPSCASRFQPWWPVKSKAFPHGLAARGNLAFRRWTGLAAARDHSPARPFSPSRLPARRSLRLFCCDVDVRPSPFRPRQLHPPPQGQEPLRPSAARPSSGGSASWRMPPGWRDRAQRRPRLQATAGGQCLRSCYGRAKKKSSLSTVPKIGG